MLLCDSGHSFVFLAWKTKEKIKRNHIKLQVMWDEKFPEHGELATLFGFGNTSLPSSTKYMGMCEPLPFCLGHIFIVSSRSFISVYLHSSSGAIKNFDVQKISLLEVEIIPGT